MSKQEATTIVIEKNEPVKPTLKLKKWDYTGGESYLKFSFANVNYVVENMTDDDVDTFAKLHPNQTLFAKK